MGELLFIVSVLVVGWAIISLYRNMVYKDIDEDEEDDDDNDFLLDQ